MSIEQANLLLSQFGDVIGLEGLALDERGYACLTFDDVAVNLEYEPTRNALALFAWLGEADRNHGGLLLALLEANLLAHATGEPVFGYEAAAGGVVLLDRLGVAGLDSASLQDRLGAFLTVAAAWRARLAGDGPGAPAPAALPSFLLRA